MANLASMGKWAETAVDKRAKSPFARNQFWGGYWLLLLVGYILVFSGQHSVVPIL